MHFAAWLSVADSVRDPLGYYDNNVGGALSVLRGDGDVRREALHLLVDGGHVRRTRVADADHRRPSTAADQRVRRDQAGGRARAAALRARLRHALRPCCAISTRRARIPTAARRGSLARDPRDPARDRRRARPRAVRDFGDDYDTPDGTCLRDLRPRDRPRVGARAGARRAARRRARPRHTISATAGRCPFARWSTAVERVTGRQVLPASAPRRAGDPAVLFASSDRSGASWAGAPRIEDARRDRRNGLALARTHPHG